MLIRINGRIYYKVGVLSRQREAERYGVDGDVRYNQAFANSLWIQVQGNFTFAKSRYLYFEEAERPWMPWGAHKGKPFDAHWGFVAERLFIDQYDRSVYDQLLFYRSSPFQTN